LSFSPASLLITNDGLTFSNVNISANTGMKIYHAKGVKFVGSKLVIESGKALTTFNADVTGLDDSSLDGGTSTVATAWRCAGGSSAPPGPD